MKFSSAACLSAFALFFLCYDVVAKEENHQSIVFTRAFADNDYGNYHVAVLQAALNATPDLGTTTLVPHPQPMSQSRQLVSLINGEADVMWSATSQVREKQLIPIRLPLLKGFAGFRVFVINPDKQDSFNYSIDSSTLKTRTLVQGSDWPDLTVLSSNGYNIEGEDWSLWFNSMYSLVEKNLVDAFPRNIIEVHRELSRHSDKHVSLEQYHLLNYPNYEYFFVSPNNQALANRLKIGLIRILENGELNNIFNYFDYHEEAGKLVDSGTRRIHYLDNPNIPYRINYARWDKHPQLAIEALRKELNELRK